MLKFFILLVTIISMSSANDIMIDTILSQAKKSNKHALIFLHKPYCPYCKSMIYFTLKNKKIVSKIGRRFIFIDINIADSGIITFKDFKGTRKEFAKFLGYNFYPSTVFINKNKEIVYEQPGYQDKDRFLHILRYVNSHSYEEIGIEEFK